MSAPVAMTKDKFRRPAGRWLLLCAILVALMVVVGGYTRLSGSGLSITEWKPIHGTIPPLTAQEWQEEFDQYRMSPQYRQVNFGMTLEEFRGIFWPEYIHRLLGRVIGLAFFLPMLYFAARRAFNAAMFKRLCVIFLLGGAQGALGWYMVASGLVHDPRVSHYRLAAHFGFALLILASLTWTWLDLRWMPPKAKPFAANTRERYTRRMQGELKGIFILLCLQLVYGAFMAGLHAGLIYNTFPTMDGQWLPPEAFSMQPAWANLTENIPMVQFIHRWLGVTLTVLLTFWWFGFRKNAISQGAVRLATTCVLVCWVQVGFGIVTLLMQVRLSMGLLHQFTGMLLFVLLLALLHRLQREQV